jgi:hypothetical protein
MCRIFEGKTSTTGSTVESCDGTVQIYVGIRRQNCDTYDWYITYIPTGYVNTEHYFVPNFLRKLYS